MVALSPSVHGLPFDQSGPIDFFSQATSAGSYLQNLISSSTRASLPYFTYPLLLVPLIFPLYRFILNDYEQFLSLGPGGTPSTFNGYLRVTFLKAFFSRTDVYVPPVVTPYEQPARGYLTGLPPRSGSRPAVAGIAPHRQTTQKGTTEMNELLKEAFYALRKANSMLLDVGISCFEKHCLGIFFSPTAAQIELSPIAKLPVPRSISALSLNRLSGASPPCDNPKTAVDGILGPINASCGHPAEIVHLHNTDSSMHLTLHPADAAVVINNGWGERHPLAGRGPWVPKLFVMVYAPRSPEELKIAMKIVRAGAWWVGGCLLKSANEDLGGDDLDDNSTI